MGCGGGWELISIVPAQKYMAPPCYVSVGLSIQWINQNGTEAHQRSHTTEQKDVPRWNLGHLWWEQFPGFWTAILTESATNTLPFCMRIITLRCHGACSMPSFQMNSALLAHSVSCSLCLKCTEFEVLLPFLVGLWRNSLNPSEHMYIIILTMKIRRA